MDILNEGLLDAFARSNESTTTPQQEIELGKKKKKQSKATAKIADVVKDNNQESKKPVGAPSQKQLINNSSSSIELPVEVKDVITLDAQAQIDLEKQLAEKKVTQEVESKKEDKEKRAAKTVRKAGRKRKVIEDVVNQKTQEAEQKGQVVTPQLRNQIMQDVADSVSIEQITPDDFEAVKDVIEEENNVNLDGVNIPKLAEGIGAAIEEIPDAPEDITELSVTPLTKKTREGYYKVKVTIKKEGIPEIINQISSEVKKRTKGLISPRVCDLRVIGNTNKTQLRNSTLKLSVNTVVFKPDASKLKVNKGTRFMISIPENFNSTGNLLVYIQESRAKTIIEINTNELSDTVDFFATNISDYYYQGYDVTLKKLQRKGVGCPIMEVVNLIVANRGYRIKTYGDNEDNHIYMVDLSSKDTETNEFIGVRIKEGNQPGLWDVIAFDKSSAVDEYGLNQENKSIKYLMDNILSILNKVYDMDWNKIIVDEEYNAWKNTPMSKFDDSYDVEYEAKRTTTYNEIKKLKHRKLISAAYDMLSYAFYDREDDIIQHIEEVKELDLTLKCMSKQAMKKHSPENYDAECVIGKSTSCSFVLTYLAYPIKAGDKRAGRDYITRQQYYQRYNVRDRREYQNREKTILRRQNEQRNYNARPYLFQLEYKINGSDNTYKYVCKTYTELKDATQFLTMNPIGINKIP